jgi:basic membrane lipoprotein Med (substrate-binding protein (PBP1-ABC) superfamily)
VRNRLTAIFLLLLILAACGKPTATSTPAAATAVPVTESPTLTPLPATPLVILILPADMAADESALYQKTIYDLAQANAMRFQVLNALTVEDVQREGPALKIVVAFPPDPGLDALAAAAPSVQFLAISIPGLTPAANLSTIGANGAPVDHQAFLAGYIAAMLAFDYRTGMLGRQDDSQTKSIEIAFGNGMSFYCGICKHNYPPYDYPVILNITAGSPVEQYPAWTDALRQRDVDVVYVPGGVATVDVLESFAQKDLKIISVDMPVSDLQSNWIVSLKPQLLPAIQQIFPDLLAGRGGQTLAIPLVLSDVNTSLLTEGKARLVQQTLDDLQSGFIGTGVNP